MQFDLITRSLLEKFSQYTVPKDPARLLMDFYTINLINGLKYDFSGSIDKVATFGRPGKELQQDIVYAEDKIYPALGQMLDDSVFLAIASEMQFIFSRTQKWADHPELTDNETFKYYARDLKHKKSSDSALLVHKAEREEFNPNEQSDDDTMKSLRSALKAIKQTGSSKTKFAEIGYYCFNKLQWSSLFGGKKWGHICRGYIKLHNALSNFKHQPNPKTRGTLAVAIDHAVDLAHNTNTVLNKSRTWYKGGAGGGWSWIGPVLDFKRNAPAHAIVDKSSGDLKRLGYEALKAAGVKRTELSSDVQRLDKKVQHNYPKFPGHVPGIRSNRPTSSKGSAPYAGPPQGAYNKMPKKSGSDKAEIIEMVQDYLKKHLVTQPTANFDFYKTKTNFATYDTYGDVFTMFSSPMGMPGHLVSSAYHYKEFGQKVTSGIFPTSSKIVQYANDNLEDLSNVVSLIYTSKNGGNIDLNEIISGIQEDQVANSPKPDEGGAPDKTSTEAIADAVDYLTNTYESISYENLKHNINNSADKIKNNKYVFISYNPLIDALFRYQPITDPENMFKVHMFKNYVERIHKNIQSTTVTPSFTVSLESIIDEISPDTVFYFADGYDDNIKINRISDDIQDILSGKETVTPNLDLDLDDKPAAPAQTAASASAMTSTEAIADVVDYFTATYESLPFDTLQYNIDKDTKYADKIKNNKYVFISYNPETDKLIRYQAITDSEGQYNVHKFTNYVERIKNIQKVTVTSAVTLTFLSILQYTQPGTVFYFADGYNGNIKLNQVSDDIKDILSEKETVTPDLDMSADDKPAPAASAPPNKSIVLTREQIIDKLSNVYETIDVTNAEEVEHFTGAPSNFVIYAKLIDIMWGVMFEGNGHKIGYVNDYSKLVSKALSENNSSILLKEVTPYNTYGASLEEYISSYHNMGKDVYLFADPAGEKDIDFINTYNVLLNSTKFPDANYPQIKKAKPGKAVVDTSQGQDVSYDKEKKEAIKYVTDVLKSNFEHTSPDTSVGVFTTYISMLETGSFIASYNNIIDQLCTYNFDVHSGIKKITRQTYDGFANYVIVGGQLPEAEHDLVDESDVTKAFTSGAMFIWNPGSLDDIINAIND